MLTPRLTLRGREAAKGGSERWPAAEGSTHAVASSVGRQGSDSSSAFRVEAASGDGRGDLREAVSRAALERGIPILELRAVATSLEDIFVRYTAGAEAN